VSSLVCSPNGIFLAGAVGSTVKIWRASDGSLEKAVTGCRRVSSISFSPNGKLVASGDHDGDGIEVRIRTADGRNVAVHAFEKDEEGNSTACVTSIAFAPNGQTLASGGHGDECGFIFLWDTREFV
jgi:WD40 repeat protein